MKEILLTKGFITQIDDTWFYEIDKYKWFYNNGYAARREKRKIVYMHRIINNTPDGFDTDHIDGNKLNNQSKNLRIATRSQNLMNKKISNKFDARGVSYHKRKKKYQSSICCGGHQIHLGYYDSIEDAKNAYDEASRKYFGEFASQLW